jgi:hypothetical protein
MSAFTFIVNGSINIPGFGSHFLLFIVPFFPDIKALRHVKHVLPHRDISTSVTLFQIFERPLQRLSLNCLMSPYATNL